MSELTVSELAIYPVKSLRQIPLPKATVGPFGLISDRRWMVVDNKGNMITQRQQPRMCLIQPTLLEGNLLLTAESMDELILTPASQQQIRQVKIWGDTCNGIDCGNAVAQWLSEFLHIECRLVSFPEDELRQVDLTYAKPGDHTAFSDGFPILLTSQASLDDLNQRLQSPIPMSRFRPNLVISGCEPYAEDSWRQIQINNLTLRIVKPCSRCVIPSIDVATGDKGVEPTRTLLDYRQRDHKIFFGQNVITNGTGEIQVGMPVKILD